jgi:hypothetical protein
VLRKRNHEIKEGIKGSEEARNKAERKIRN